MDTIIFGAGKLYATDSSGNVYPVGVLSDVSLEYTSTTKSIKGSKRFAIATAVAEEKLAGKIGSAVFDGKLLAAILGGTVSTGQKLVATETTTAASLTVTNSATFVEDLGVTVNGVPLTKKASAPALGEYSVAAGVYTFNASQTGTKSVSYRYTVTTGNTVAITNRTQGSPTSFSLVLDETYESGHMGVKLNKVIFPKYSFAGKADEFSDQGIDFEALADSSDSVGEVYFS